jgi:pimeloyl-ACP methyl ester carboxylesterase
VAGKQKFAGHAQSRQPAGRTLSRARAGTVPQTRSHRSWMPYAGASVPGKRSVWTLGLVLLACSESEVPLAIPDGARPGELSITPCTYEARGVEYSADCGTLVVPENRADSGSRLIGLPVVRVHATGGTGADPIFWLAGGPGASNMEFTRLRGLIQSHDIVMVGYRGVDGSVVLDCPEVTRLFRQLPGDLLSDTTTAAITTAYGECGARLRTEGVDTDGYTLIEVVDDIEAARQGLGYERVNLLGQSYGTRLALICAWLYPERVHRSAMISVNPPGHFVWFPDVIDEQMEHYATLCAQDAECSTRTDDLAETMRRVSHNMPRRWLVFPVERGAVLAATFGLLYHTTTADLAFDAWLAADAGDASGLALMTLLANLMFPSASVWGESAAKATSADYVYDPTRDFQSEMNPPSSILGSPTSMLGWAAAQGWPANLIGEELRSVRPSDVDMLLVSGNIDFSTPARFATEELLPFLINGRQVVLSEFGHTDDVWTLQPEATVRLLTSFFDTGVADSSLYDYQPMSFHVGLGLTEMAKLGVAAMVVLFFLLVALVWLVVWLARRRRARREATAT